MELTPIPGVNGSVITFNDLPSEIRVRIWQLTVEPRTVEVRIVPYSGTGYRMPTKSRRAAGDLWSTTPVPASLQVCYETRNIGLYKQVFYEATEADDAERRHVWVNADIDLVDIGWALFFRRNLLPPIMRELAPIIRRLLIGGNCSEEDFFRWEYDGFVNLEEVHIVCGDGAEEWRYSPQEYSWPCSLENVFFIDPFAGRVIRGTELGIMCAEMDERDVGMDGLFDEMDYGRQVEMEALFTKWERGNNQNSI